MFSFERLSRLGVLAWVLIAGGVLAWGVAVALVVSDRPQDAPTPLPVTASLAVGELPTLGAVTVPPTATASSTPSVTPSPTSTTLPTLPPTATRTGGLVPPATWIAPSSATPTMPPTITPALTTALPIATPTVALAAQGAEACSPPEGWERYTVQDGDTLFAFVLGAGPEAGLTVDDLMAANCLKSRYLLVGQVLYLPPGAAENAPPSDPYVPPEALAASGPRTPNCPCTLTVREGWRREQIAEAVQQAPVSFTGADFLAVTGPGVSVPFDFAMARPAGASLEGFLFPGTYTLQNDTTAEQFRDMLLSAFAANVSPQMRADAAAQGVTFYQALTIASIVQRESRAPETQKLIASVDYNNYRAGGRLGETVTVQYVLGRPGAWWPRVRGSDLEIDSPYNTYKYPGIPPGPICNPGMSAILAAVYPPATDYRFHTASCNGTGEAFAVTYEEHLANVNCQ